MIPNAPPGKGQAAQHFNSYSVASVHACCVGHRYLQYGKYQDKEAVLAKTHIFTTYFYKRLTTRPSSKNKANKHHPVEDDPSLSPAEKRYDRVRKWTKKVNLFDKDFIVVPINEHAHWFVCIICFPGEFFSPICNVFVVRHCYHCFETVIKYRIL